MNRTMAFIAVVLTMVTAFFIVSADNGSDGAIPDGYTEVSDANTICYTNDTLPATKIYITSSSIKADAFKDCTNLKQVELSDNVRLIGDRAFEGCTGLSSFKAPALKTIGSYCFKDTGYVNYDFSPSLTSIGTHAFENCKGTGPYLLNTNVSEIKSGTYTGSKVLFEDLRSVATIASDAFSNTNLKAQILDDGQSTMVAGIPVITMKDLHIEEISSLYLSTTKEYELTFFTKNAGAVLQITDSSGTVSAKTTSSPLSGGCYVYYFSGQSLRIEGGSWTIHFPEITGLSDDVHKSGEGTYQIPYPNVASNLFKSWNIRGETAARTSISESDFAKANGDIYLEITYNTFTVIYDHSALTDSAGLPSSGTFTVGDCYPTLSDISGYDFTGWYVGTKFYDGGSKITTYRNHTAVSSWNANTFTVSVMCDGNKIATKSVAANTELRLSELSVTVPDSKRFLGWSLESNGTLLTADPIISSNCSVFAVFEDKAQYTVRYLDGTTVLGSLTAYDGDNISIQQNNPICEGKTFQNWKLGDTESKLYKGDSLRIESNIDLHAIWLVDKKTVKYVVDGITKTVTYDYGDTVIIGCDSAAKDGFTLQGWSLSSSGEILYHDGDRFTITDNVKIYSIWTENAKLTVTIHFHDGTTSETKVEHGASYTLPINSGWAQHTFDGWAVSENGAVSYRTGDSLSILDDIDFFEVWKLDPAQDTSVTEEPSSSESEVPPTNTDPKEDQSSTEPVRSDEKSSTTEEPNPSEQGINEEKPTTAEKPAESEQQLDDKREQPGEKPQQSEQTAPAPQPSSGRSSSTTNPSSGSSELIDNTPTIPSTLSLVFMNGSSLLASYDVSPYSIQDLSVAGTPEKTGYRFIGWSENSKAITASLTSQSTKMIVKNTTLYAVWEKLLEVNYHDGESVDTVYCEKNEQLALRTSYKEGFRFIGWNEKNSSTILSDKLTVTTDMDLYAQWEIVKTENPASDIQTTTDIPQTIADPTEEMETVPEITNDSSDNGFRVTTIGTGAAVAAIVSTILIVQLRRA